MAVRSEFLTFLFTDIEGSTALWERHAAEMEGVVARHDELLHAVITACDGTVVGGRGDGVFAVFPSPRNAVRASQAAQRALAEEQWSGGIALRVRMGLHAGEATARDGDWFGTEVNRAARVAAVAHGGQIVCTRIVEELVRDDCDLVDLGEHRLRDLQSTVHLFQVEIPGAPAVHPPLRSIDAHLTNLPYELSSFVGRERELAELETRMHESRLVSIVGVGGVGKTRLALQVAAAVLPDHPDGVWLCELAAVTDADAIPDAIAAAVRYTPPAGVPVATGLQQFLERKNIVLVLDNCEHIVGAVAHFVAETTARAPGVGVLATSREALGIPGEHIFPLPSLSLPTDAEAVSVSTSEAGTLFTSRAREVRGDFALDDQSAPAIHSICTRLDGIPLAIELAAAQTSLMTPGEIDRRLDRQFTALSGGRRNPLERHQTLRAAIDWSYDLLTPGAQRLLDRLSVCVGGFDLDAADALAEGIDDGDGFALLSELVAKSLVERYEIDATTRYRVLEMIRQYAADRLLNGGEDAAARDTHARHHLALLETRFAELRSDREYEALAALEVETPNIAAGIRWWLATDHLDEIFACFATLPFFDCFCLSPYVLEELGGAVRPAIDHHEARTFPGCSYVCLLAGYRAYVAADLDDYRRIVEIAQHARDVDESPALGVTSATIDMFAGDIGKAVRDCNLAVEAARRSGDPAALAWTLAHLSMHVDLHEMGQAEADVRENERGRAQAPSALAAEALAVACQVEGTIGRLYPLTAVVTNHRYHNPERMSEPLHELVELDHTPRRWWATIAMSVAAQAGSSAGSLESIRDFRALIAGHHEREERFLLVLVTAGFADSAVDIDGGIALELGAICESDAIAPYAAFGVQPALGALAAERPDEVADARLRVATFTYDEAIARIFANIDALLGADDT
jgi:predicted ATPase/class 3 adenylate cyclase